MTNIAQQNHINMFPKPFRRLLKTTRFWQNYALILSELKHFPKTLSLAILFPLIAAVFEGFGISFLLGFLQNLVSSTGQPFETGFQWFDVWVLGSRESSLDQLYRLSGLILISTWIRAVFNYLSGVYVRKAEVSLTSRLYKRAFEQLQAVSLRFFSKVRGGDLLNTMTTEVNQLQLAVSQIGFVLSKGAVVLVYAFIALRISWPLTLSAVMLFSLTATGLSTLNKRIREASFPVSAARSQLTATTSEFISGIRTVQAFATQDFERRRFYKACDNYVNAAITVVKRTNVIRPLAEAIGSTILIGMIIVGMTIFVSDGSLQVASLLTFLFILFRMVPAIQELNGVAASLSSIQGSISNIQNLLRTDNKPYLQNGHKSFTG
ncbi:MAG TPA: ABC transporter ATP-binding protein, partial [Phormidium sp.]